MDLIPVRSSEDKQLPWSKHSIYKFSSENKYPEIIIKIDGKLFLDMDAFREKAVRARDEQIKKAATMRRGTE